MKQHITVEQIKEFTNNQRERIEQAYELAYRQKPIDFYNRLPEFAKQEKARTYDEWFYNYMIKKDGQRDYEFSNKINIGRMIEFLESKDPCLNITKLINDGGCWGYEIKLRIVKYYKFSKGELADALWEAVKEFL